MSDQSLITTTQAITVPEYDRSYNDLVKFVKTKLKENVDYGIIPGTKKKSLYKPGSEKIAFLFGLKPNVELMEKVEDWEKGFFFYRYKATLIHFASGKPAGSAERSCNSKEKKYAYNSVNEFYASADEKDLAIKKIQKKNGQYTNTFLIIRKTAEEQADQVNTIMAMAQKRAIVAAVVQATMASEIFDADASPDDDTAPNKSMTAEEDPRRAGLMMRLYGTAKEHGWTDKWIHAAVKKKWDKESLTEISNTQIEELTEFIVTKYESVGPDVRPVERGFKVVEGVIEGAEIVDIKKEDIGGNLDVTVSAEDSEPTDPIICRNAEKHGVEKVIVPEGSENPYFCNKECENEYWGKDKKDSKEKLEAFIQKGKLQKEAEDGKPAAL